MKSFNQIGTDALVKIFANRKPTATFLSKGKLKEKTVKATCEVVVMNKEVNLTTEKFATLSSYENVKCYQWGIRHGLKELPVGVTYSRMVGGDFDGWGQSKITEKIKTIADGIFKKNGWLQKENVLEHISHIVLEYQLSADKFKIVIYPLTEKVIEGILKRSIRQEIYFFGEIPKKIETV
jgi:hypothetical protein